MDKGEIAQLLRRLVTVDGPSGVEGAVAEVVRELAAPYAPEISVDALGSVIARRPATGGEPAGRIMLAAHMDEIGLIVTRVEGGFLHVGKIGGVDPRGLIGQEVM